MNSNYFSNKARETLPWIMIAVCHRMEWCVVPPTAFSLPRANEKVALGQNSPPHKASLSQHSQPSSPHSYFILKHKDVIVLLQMYSRSSMSLFLSVTLYSAAFIKDPFNDPSKKYQSSTSCSVDFLPFEHAVFLEILVKKWNWNIFLPGGTACVHHNRLMISL